MRGSVVFLVLEFESIMDGLDSGVFDVGGGVDQVEVFFISFVDDMGVRVVVIFSNILVNGVVEFVEDSSVVGVVQISEFVVREGDFGYFDWVIGDELDDIFGQVSFEQDLVDELVGGDG